jgi:GH24 family phage-related lysozyme (muramidase)
MKIDRRQIGDTLAAPTGGGVAMSGNYMERALAQIAIFEGSVAWMYVDTVGKVTVGVGLMLPDVVAAQALPFLAAGQAATAEQIAAEFARVSAMALGKLPGFYKTPTCLQLEDACIQQKLQSVLAGFEEKLRARWPNYDQFPDEAKMALLDMSYNLGPDGLLKGYPTLVKTLTAGDWAAAAEQCQRRGPAPARNDWTKQMFLTAAVSGTAKPAETVIGTTATAPTGPVQAASRT